MENKSQEDREDLNVFKERCDEPLIPLEEVVNGLSNKETCGWDSSIAVMVSNKTHHNTEIYNVIVYDTDCGIKHIQRDPLSKNFMFCPYCSKPIEEANNE